MIYGFRSSILDPYITTFSVYVKNVGTTNVRSRHQEFEVVGGWMILCNSFVVTRDGSLKGFTTTTTNRPWCKTLSHNITFSFCVCFILVTVNIIYNISFLLPDLSLDEFQSTRPFKRDLSTMNPNVDFLLTPSDTDRFLSFYSYLFL